jgi:hypothetical protein
MKQNLFTSKNIPYITSGISVLLGYAIITVGHMSEGPVTHDPNIGASLISLLGYTLVTAGVITSLITLLIRKFKSSK